VNVVASISWMDNGISHCQLYGPFPVAEDSSHLADVAEFTGRWIAENGQPSDVTLYLVQPPESVGACDS
jgi:hypothetical protein